MGKTGRKHILTRSYISDKNHTHKKKTLQDTLRVYRPISPTLDWMDQVQGSIMATLMKNI